MTRSARTARPRPWSLVAILVVGCVPWLVTITVLGIGCENRPDDICDTTSPGTFTVLLLALQAPVVGGWWFGRRRASHRWFLLPGLAALGVNVTLAVLALLWNSGDLG